MIYFNLKPVQEQKGVYLLYTKDELAYIGKSNNILRRLQQHLHITEEESITELWKKDIDKIEYYICNSLADCELLETYLINTLAPKYNIDKVYPDKLTLVISSLPQKYELPVLEPSIYYLAPKSIPYQETLKNYVSILSKDFLSIKDTNFIEEINTLEPSIKLAVDVLGIKRIRTLRYHKAKINEEIHFNTDFIAGSISNYLVSKIEMKKFYSMAQCKELLKEIYKILGFSKIAKGIDILKYLKGTIINKRIEGILLQGCIFNIQ